MLQKNTQEIARNLVVTETLLGCMFQTNLFDSEMIEMIKACKTNVEKVYKMLEFLPRRGPDAFDNFLEILQDDNSWVVNLLRDSLETESERILATQTTQTRQGEAATTPRTNSANGTQMDADIKIRVSAFVQKHFAQIRRISNTDKKTIEWMMSKWLTAERKRISKSIDQVYMDAHHADVLGSKVVKDHVFALCTQISAKQRRSIVKRILNKGQRLPITSAASNDTEPMETDDPEFTPETATFEHLKEEISKIFKHMDYMERQIERSYDYLGARHSGKEISILVHEMCGEYRYKETELHKEKNKIEKMLVELYNFSTNSSKLENTIHAQEHEIIALKEQINKQKSEITELIKEITQLEKEKLQHMEKERTLLALKKTKEDLQLMLDVVNKQNTELKEKLQGLTKALPKGQQIRRPINNVVNSTRQSPRRNVQPKRRSLSFR